MEPEAPEQGFNLAVQVTHFTSGVPIEEPVWSPDGTRLAFVYGNQESNDKVEVANSNGTTATPLVVAEHGVHPTWAPESGKIAYSYEGHIYVEEADGAGFPPPLTGAEGRRTGLVARRLADRLRRESRLRQRQPRDRPRGRRDAGHAHLRAAVHLSLLVALGVAGRLQGERRTTAGRQRRRQRRPSAARDLELNPNGPGALVVARRHADRLPGLLLRLRTVHQRRLHAEHRRLRRGHPPGPGRKILHLSLLETEPGLGAAGSSPRRAPRAAPHRRCR